MIEFMRAAVCVRYGPPETLELTRIAKSVSRADEILIRIKGDFLTSVR
jgi:hypothetical protein